MHQNGALIVPNETIILFLAHIHHELLHWLRFFNMELVNPNLTFKYIVGEFPKFINFLRGCIVTALLGARRVHLPHSHWLIIKVIDKYYYKQYECTHFMTTNRIIEEITMSSHRTQQVFWWIDVHTYISQWLLSLLNIVRGVQVRQRLQHGSTPSVGTTSIQNPYAIWHPYIQTEAIRLRPSSIVYGFEFLDTNVIWYILFFKI
jgi:hypothetical protein